MRDGTLFRTYCLPLQCPVLTAVLPHDVAQVPARGGRVRAADQHRQAGVAAAGVRPRPSRARDHSVAGNLPTSRQARRREGERTGFVSAVVWLLFRHLSCVAGVVVLLGCAVSLGCMRFSGSLLALVSCRPGGWLQHGAVLAV